MDWDDLLGDLGDLLPDGERRRARQERRRARRAARRERRAGRRRWYWPLARYPQPAPPTPRSPLGHRIAELAQDKDRRP